MKYTIQMFGVNLILHSYCLYNYIFWIFMYIDNDMQKITWYIELVLQQAFRC